MGSILATQSSQLVADVSASGNNKATIPDLQLTAPPGQARQVVARIHLAAAGDVTTAFDVTLTLQFADAGFETTDIWGKPTNSGGVGGLV